MGLASTMQLNSHCLAYFNKLPCGFTHISRNVSQYSSPLKSSGHVCFSRGGQIRAISEVPESQSAAPDLQEPPLIDFVFVHSVLLPDGSPDIHCRRTCGGQKLRDVMLDNNIELYGPDARPLLNCAGGGTCGTCMVEVIMGKELLSPRTNKEKELLKKKPKNYRLACQTTVGNPESTGMVVIQQLPEWKAHDWQYEKVPDPDDSSNQ